MYRSWTCLFVCSGVFACNSSPVASGGSADADDNSLSGLSCLAEQHALFDGNNWICAAESDPIFSAAAAAGITNSQVSNWDAAHAWGDHSRVGYHLPTSSTQYAHQHPGSDAGAKIAACIAALPTAGGTCDARGLENGELSEHLSIARDHVSLLLGSSTLVMHEYQIAVSGDHVSISGLDGATHLDATGGTTQHAIHVTGQHAVIEKLLVTGARGSGNLPHGIRVQDAQHASISHTIVRDAGGAGISVSNSSDVHVVDNRVFQSGRSGILVIGSSTHVLVDGNHVEDVNESGQQGHGGITVLGGAQSPSFIQIVNNTVVSPKGVGIRSTTTAGGVPANIRIVNNSVQEVEPEQGDGDGEGIAVSSKHVQIIGNRIDRAYVTGIQLWGFFREDIIVANNIVSNSSQHPTKSHNAIAMQLLDQASPPAQVGIIIVNNIGFDDQTPPTQVRTVGINRGNDNAGLVESVVIGGNVGRNQLQPEAVLIPAELASEITTYGNVP